METLKTAADVHNLMDRMGRRQMRFVLTNGLTVKAYLTGGHNGHISLGGGSVEGEVALTDVEGVIV